MDEQQQKRFERAVERKKEEARIASEQTGHETPSAPDVTGDIQPDIIAASSSQDRTDPRDKNTQHRKMTADKWNQ